MVLSTYSFYSYKHVFLNISLGNFLLSNHWQHDVPIPCAYCMFFCLHISIIWCHSVCKNFIKKETCANHIKIALLLADCNQTQASSSPLTPTGEKHSFLLNADCGTRMQVFRNALLNIALIFNLCILFTHEFYLYMWNIFTALYLSNF